MKTKIFLSAFFILNIFSLAQVRLTEEKVDESTYRLKFKNEVPYKIEKEGNVNKIIFKGFMDEGREGQFILPRKEFFINIPAGTKPQISFTPLSLEVINAIPQINPSVERLDDSTLVYSEAELDKSKLISEPYEVKGYLWIDDEYCVHVSANLFEYSINERLVKKIDEFIISLKFQETLNYEIVKTAESRIPISNNEIQFPGETKRNKFPVSSAGDWIDYSKNYIKIGTRADAIYRLNIDDLSANGVPVNSVNPKSFKLFWKGNEIPIYVGGENDLSFDENDYIEFVGRLNYGDDYRELAAYGQPHKEYKNRYSDTTIYWLTWDGADGKRVDTVLANTMATNDTIDYYDVLIHTELDHWYDYTLSGGQVRREEPDILENETWLWWGQNVGTRNFSFQTTNLYPGKPAKGFVKIQSRTTNISTNSHLLALKINSHPAVYDSGYMNKYEIKVLKADYNSNLLVNGSNTLKLVSYLTTGTLNQCFGDWWEVEFPRYLTLSNDSLLFAYRSLEQSVYANIKITNVNAENFSLFRFDDDYNNVKITDYNRNGSTITFRDTVRPNSKYLITSDEKIASPIVNYSKNFVNLRDPANQADYILITHPYYMNDAVSYLSFIESEYQVSTKLINVFDIYDEFNYGFLAPEPIKSFLMMTNDKWADPNPKYVFLLGRSTYDFHGNKTKYFGDREEKNFVPSYGVPVSDNWFVIWDSTGAAIPQMNIGRLPARSVEEFQHYFDKHQNYVSQNYDKWNKSYLFYSGGNFTDTVQLNQLRGVNNFVIDNYVTPHPIGGIYKHFYKTPNPITNFGPYTQRQIQDALDAGGLFISYLGHSGTQTWDNSITDPSQLDNKVGRSSMITDFGCSTAKHSEPDITSFSELFVNGLTGQAISYIGNSSLGFTSTSFTFPKIFFRSILKDSAYSISEAHRIGKMELINTYGASGTFRLFMFTNTLVGDPIISLPIPSKPNLTVSAADLQSSSLIPSDNEDSLWIKLNYYNLGSVSSDSFTISAAVLYEEIETEIVVSKKSLPKFIDSLAFSIPIKDKPGSHKISVALDQLGEITELNEQDNLLTYDVNVLSASVRTTSTYVLENKIVDKITFLNPVIEPLDKRIQIDLSLDESIQNPFTSVVPFDTFYTDFPVPNNYLNKRFWMRAKLPDSNVPGLTQSFYTGGDKGFAVYDSLGFAQFAKSNIYYLNGGIELDTNRINFRIISEGYEDGNSALVLQNGQNFIPENTVRGQHICLFDAYTYEFVKYLLFDIRDFTIGPQQTQAYIQFLDTLSSNYLIAIAISSDAHVTDTTLISQIKSLGSVYIDSLQYLSSWSILGRKGAVPGSVPETFTYSGEGSAIADSAISFLHPLGSLTSTAVGPASSWNKLTIDFQTPDNSGLKAAPIGLKASGEKDTLTYLDISSGEPSLTHIDAAVYPKLKLLFELNESSNAVSPKLNSFNVNYTSLPELGTNFQVVSLDADSVLQGEPINLSFFVYNAGDTQTDSFSVSVDLIHQNNEREEIFTKKLSSLQPFAREMVDLSYNTVSTNGSKQFLITVDPLNDVNEIYEDNNFYTVPFKVIGDTTRPDMIIIFDGRDILDGEYISSNPVIRIELFDPSLIPISVDDTTTISIYLNNQLINYNELEHTISADNPKSVVEYKPVLTGGEYELRVFGQDASGNVVDSSGIRKTFIVSEETSIIDFYNYPNPFAESTYFTFKLTQIPDELQLKIYTIAGRLVKEINLSPAELRFDFNKIFWDGKDEDGDELANGVYILKALMIDGENKTELMQKLAKVR